MSNRLDFPVNKGKKRKRRLHSQEPLLCNEQPSSGSKKDSVSRSKLTKNVSAQIPKKKACLRQIGETSQVCTEATVYRVILEVLKICSPRDVLLNASLVNKRWTDAGSSRELWFVFQEDMYVPGDNISTHPKTTCAAYSYQQHALVSLSGKDISTFNNKTVREKTTPLSTPLTPQHYSFALLLDGSLLCCGGQISSGDDSTTAKNTYIVSADGTVSVQRDMINARRSHGILAFGRKVFVFGGVESFLTMVLKNEMFEGGSWSLLPELCDARYAFVPCIYQGRIYLSGGLTSSVEVFDPEAMSMSILDGVTIPIAYYSVATIHDNCLVVITDSKVYRWSFKTKSMKTKNKSSLWIFNATRTVRRKNLLYVIEGCGFSCNVMELKTGKLLFLT